MVEQEAMIGSSLRGVRRRRGMTLRQVAEAAGVTESFLSQVERDVASPSIATLRRIAVALGTSIGVILDEAGPHGQLVRAGGPPVGTYPGPDARGEFLTEGNRA